MSKKNKMKAINRQKTNLVRILSFNKLLNKKIRLQWRIIMLRWTKRST